ncbi:type VII secretion protein EsaA [Bacillus cytotoxicus]|uniref:type VII secretion protein EsaA n=2 Tax=Bacillus cytotoxicus TaxID=580165 RepID=UPI000B973DE2|nr:type VII secretion protein EsaA [Bacillus cytotoxicus]AWC56697.1 type VII secretion protein EsaA [Bacillus cytotoxicus]
MKKMKWSTLLFLVLALVFATSTSYLALNKKLKNEDSKYTPKMAVALVNEDEGTVFEGNKIAFGDQYINNINKDQNHQWYVVSRGVAESGLKNNNYNLMIVIPNDFSRKAVSINSESPEKLTLSYKVNAIGNKELKAEAEKTAASILEDFNRRIIDVYFASIIGKLQAAQDNIETIVDKEQSHMKMYKSNIHSPLANYTNQFKTVQDYTGASVDSFKGFQGVLQRFGQTIDEDAKWNHTYLEEFNNLQNLKKNNSVLENNFSNQFNQFTSELNEVDTLKQLSLLESANKAIANHFNKVENQTNVLLDAAIIQEYLKDVNNKMKDYDAELTNKLQTNMQESINTRLKEKLSGNDKKEVNITTLLQEPNNRMKKQIESLINQLPSMNIEEIDKLILPDETKRTLKNVVEVSKKYSYENDFNNKEENGAPLTNTIETIKTTLMTDGVVFQDTERKPQMDAAQTFTLQLPEGFGLYEDSGALIINGIDYTAEYLSNGNVMLPAQAEENLSIRVHAKLLNNDANIDVFKPVTWKWDLTHTSEKVTNNLDPEVTKPSEQGENNDDHSNVQVVQLTNRAKVPIHSLYQVVDNKRTAGNNKGEQKPEGTKEPNDEGEQKPEGTKEPNGEGEQKPGDTTKPNDEGEQKPGDTTKPNGEDEQKPGDTTKPNDEDEQKPEGTKEPNGEGEQKPEDENGSVKQIERTNDHIVHQKSETLSTVSSSELMKEAIEVVENYEKLSNLYQVYYGLDLKSENLVEQLESSSLTALASPQSLYYMLNKQNVIDVITSFVSAEIQEEVSSDIGNLKNKMKAFQSIVNNAEQSSVPFAEKLKQISDQTNVMNTNLREYLNALAKWRENSLKLVDDQKTLVSGREGERTAVMTLDSGFKSLLTKSQSLAETSKGTLQVSDDVYKTFDQINNRAKEIQDSGVTIVSKANTLLGNLTKKVTDDKDFSKNFNKVLANSRIGDRQNEKLYQFLANPVLKQNDGVITAGNIFTPYLIVLVCFIVSLFTSYTIANQERKRSPKDNFTEKVSILDMNLPITAITFGIAIIEGVIIGTIAAKLLEFSGSQKLTCIAFITITMMAFVFISTYLLRQIKMIGMFILLTFLSLYLFLTEVVGIKVKDDSYFSKLREFSPLQYVEDYLNHFINSENNGHVTFAVILGMAIVGFIINLFVRHKGWEEKKGDDEVHKAS